MNEIKCPHCGEMFTIDEAGFAAILKQVRDAEFDKEVRRHEQLMASEKQQAVQLAVAEALAKAQGDAAQKEARIAELEARLQAEQRERENQQRLAHAERERALADAVATKDARIADLERQLEAKKADDNAIAQALIIAQRSADEIIANANAQAAATIKDAEDEGTRIVDKAEAERQKVLDAIKKLEDDREDVREDYRDLLTDFIGDATRKLAEIGGEMPASLPVSAHARTIDVVETTATGRVTAPAQAPINRDGAGAYSVPQATGAVVAPATPTPSGVEKDLSGFGDADDAFEFEEID